MKSKLISHKQLAIATFIIPLALLLIEAPIALLLSKNDYLPYVLMAIQYVVVWFVCFLIYNKAFRIIALDYDKIKCNKTEIKWQKIESVELKEVKLFEYSFLPTISLASKAIIVCENKKIEIAMTKANLSKLKHFSKKSSEQVNGFIQKYMKVE